MSSHFSGAGNLGANPELRYVDANDDKLRVLQCRVYFDHPVRQPDGTFKDKDGFWANVEYWNDAADEKATLLSKGMRVVVEGRLRIDQWEDKDTKEPRVMPTIVARQLALVLNGRIEKIVMKPKRDDAQKESPQDASPHPADDVASTFDRDTDFDMQTDNDD